MRVVCSFAVTAAVAVASLLGAGSAWAHSPPCGGRDHIISAGHSGVIIIREHDISCRTVIRLGQALLKDVHRPAPRHPARLDHFTCSDIVVGHGQHAVRCTSGRAMVLFALE